MASYLDAHREEDVASHQSPFDVQRAYARPDGLLASATRPPGLYEESHQARVANVKAAAAREKMVLLDRIEQLSIALQQLSRDLEVRTTELDEYHRVFGTLGDFATRQVAMREELVSLRDSVRHWQEREQEGSEEIRRLHRLLDSVRRSGHESAEDRLGDLERRIASAHALKGNVEQQLKDLDALETARKAHISLSSSRQLNQISGVAADPDLADWQIRGKRADLNRLLEQYTANIQSLDAAADSMRSVSSSDRWTSIGAANRRCPGCGAAQWSTPFCPSTGHRHLGFEGATPARGARGGTSSPSPAANYGDAASSTAEAEAVLDDPEPTYVPPSKDELMARVEGALRSHEWSKLVQVGTFQVTYRHEASGRTVSDLAGHFVDRSREEHETRHRDWVARRGAREQRRREREMRAAEDAERSRLAKLAEEARAARGDAADHVHKGFGGQVKQLVEKLNEMTEENKKLRALLSRTAKSGVVGWHPPSQTQTPPPRGSDSTPSPHVDREVVALHDEDDVQIATKMNRLQRENTEMSARCTALILDLCKRDERIADLQQMVLNLQQINDPTAPSAEQALRSELADVRANLVIQGRKAMAADDEVRRLRAAAAASAALR
jgi:hypothetical protein